MTSSNGMYVKGGTSITVVPEGNRSPIVGSDTITGDRWKDFRWFKMLVRHFRWR